MFARLTKIRIHIQRMEKLEVISVANEFKIVSNISHRGLFMHLLHPPPPTAHTRMEILLRDLIC